jgi:heat shock protein HslJ
VSGKPKIKLASVAAGGRYSDGYTSIWSEGGELVVEAGSVKLKGCAEEGSLAGKWRVVEIGGESIRGELKAPYVEFLAEGRLAGFGGCNRFGGSYEQTGDEIVIGPLAATRMACVGAGMDLEDRFFKGFTGKLRMQRTGGRLELKHEKTVIQLRLYLDL